MKKYVLPKGYSFLASLFRTVKQSKHPLESTEESMLRFNGTYTVHLGMVRFISTQDPGFIDHVLKSNHRNYHKSEFQSKRLGRFLGKGLLTSNGDFWLRQRRLIQPGFHHEKIKSLYSIMSDTVQRFLSSFPTGPGIDVYPLTNRLAFDIVINTLFNVDIADETRRDLSAFVSDTQDFVMRDIRQPYLNWWYRLSGEERHHAKRYQHARAMIRELITRRKSGGVRVNDLLDMLLEARYEDTGLHMDEEQLIDEILVLIIAGHETTANALAWALYLLGSHPAELDNVRNASGNLGVADAVTSEALLCVIKETMRLYPPVWITDRVSLSDDAYDRYSFPGGTILILFFYGMHRDKRYWTAPLDFVPSRFQKGGEGDKNKAYLPFGAGPRLCIGNSFAMAEMAIFLQAFIRDFDFAATGAKPAPMALVTLKPDQVLLSVRRRR